MRPSPSPARPPVLRQLLSTHPHCPCAGHKRAKTESLQPAQSDGLRVAG